MTAAAEIFEDATSRRPDTDLAEKAVLGSMITFRDAAEQVLEMLDSEDCFAAPEHRAVYAAIRHLTETGDLNVRGTLAADTSDAAVGAAQSRFSAVLTRLMTAEQGAWRTGAAGLILSDLMRYATASYMADAAKVMRAAVQRRTLAATVTIRQMAAEPGFNPDEHGDLMRKLLDDALDGAASATSAVPAADLFLEAVERLDSPEPPGVIRFPWSDLQALVPWLRPGQLVTILARPSVGKSALAQDLARYTGLRQQIPCVLFTLEQLRDEVMDRLIAAEAGVLHEHVTTKTLTDADWKRIAAAQERFLAGELVIDDAPKITPAHIRVVLRGQARRAKPAKLAIVDYVQLMDGPHAENRQREVSALVDSLKGIAREFRIPLVMLCQLNRGPEHRQDKRPHMSDARESGSIENDSDVAILIHREDFYESESPRAGEADLIVDKNRNGRRGVVTVGFQGHYARFVGLAPEDQEPREWSPSGKADDR